MCIRDRQTILTSYFGAYLDRGEEIGTADFTVAQDSSRTGTAALTWDGLQPGTAYAWYAQVTNTLGSIQQTAVQRFTTAAVPADVPPTPGNAPAEPDPGPNTGNATSTGNTVWGYSTLKGFPLGGRLFRRYTWL